MHSQESALFRPKVHDIGELLGRGIGYEGGGVELKVKQGQEADVDDPGRVTVRGGLVREFGRMKKDGTQKLVRSYALLVAPSSPSGSSSRQHTPNPPAETPPPPPLAPPAAQWTPLWRLESPRQCPETDNEDFITNLT